MLWKDVIGGSLGDLVLNIVTMTIITGLIYVAVVRGVQDGMLRAAEKQSRAAQGGEPGEGSGGPSGTVPPGV